MTTRLALACTLTVVAACTSGPGPTSTASPVSQPTASATVAATASPSPTASPTLAPTLPPTLSPTATTAPLAPTATPAAAHPVIDLFLSDFAAAQPPFHVLTDVVGHASAGNQVFEIALVLEGDISGQDFDGRVSGSPLGQAIDTRLIFVDGVAYNQSDDGSWFEVDGFQQTQPLNPFNRLNASDLAYSGTAKRDGRTLHQLTTETWIGESVTNNVQNMPDAELEGSTFDIFVDDEGIPVEADLEFAVVGTIRGVPARLDYVVNYVFTNVGVPVTIEAPPPD